MKISIQFQYQPDEKRRPIDGADNIYRIESESNEFMPIPHVGDTVQYTSYHYDYDDSHAPIIESGREVEVARKVKSLHFGYGEELTGLPDLLYQ